MEFDRLVVGFLVDEVVGGFFISVPPGHIACVYDRGRGVLPYTWGPGLHMKIPFWQIAKLFNAQILEYTIDANFSLTNKEALGDLPISSTTKDGQQIQVQGSIHFRIDKKKAPLLWENVGESFVSKIVRPISRSKIANTFHGLTMEQVRTHQSHIEKNLRDELNDHFNTKGLMCESVLLTEVKPVSSHDSNLNQEADFSITQATS